MACLQGVFHNNVGNRVDIGMTIRIGAVSVFLQIILGIRHFSGACIHCRLVFHAGVVIRVNEMTDYRWILYTHITIIAKGRPAGFAFFGSNEYYTVSASHTIGRYSGSIFEHGYRFYLGRVELAVISWHPVYNKEWSRITIGAYTAYHNISGIITCLTARLGEQYAGSPPPKRTGKVADRLAFNIRPFNSGHTGGKRGFSLGAVPHYYYFLEFTFPAFHFKV